MATKKVRSASRGGGGRSGGGGKGIGRRIAKGKGVGAKKGTKRGLGGSVMRSSQSKHGSTSARGRGGPGPKGRVAGDIRNRRIP